MFVILVREEGEEDFYLSHSGEIYKLVCQQIDHKHINKDIYQQ